MTDPTKSAGGMGPYGCSEREIEIARSICDSYPVINAFTAPEWAKLDDGGKAWIATIVRQAIALGATLDTTPPSEPNPEAPTLAGPLNAVLQARADDPDRPFLSEGGGGALSPLKGEPEGLREALEALDQILGLEKCWKDTEAGVRMPYELREALKEARRAKAALLSRADTPAGAGGDVVTVPVDLLREARSGLLAFAGDACRETIARLDRAAAPKSEEEGEPRDETGRPLTYRGSHP